MGIALWFFLETADGQMKRVSNAKIQRFYDGKASISDRREDTIHTAQVVVELQDRCLARILRVFWPRYTTTASGFIDEVHRQEAMILAMRMIALDTGPENVVNLDPHLARQDMQRSHQWRPSEAQLQQVADALNRVAIRPPVVAVSRGELVPL